MIGDDETIDGKNNGNIDETMGTLNSSLVNFSFYPNPAQDVISLKSANEIESVQFYNVLGQRTLTSKVNANSKNINISNLAPGM